VSSVEKVEEEMTLIMTIKETADYLDLSPLTVRRLARNGEIPAFKAGSRWRVQRDLLDRFLEQKAALPLHTVGSRGGGEEPVQLRQGKAFHKRVQQEWRDEADGKVAVEEGVTKPSGTRGRVDVLVDAGDGLMAVVEIKSTDWDRLTLSAVRRKVSRQAQQIWDYIESQLAEGKDVSPGIIFPRRPKSLKRLALIEDLFDEEGISVVWQDETIEEARTRNTRSDIS
jgi:excisionase family DNA binding protein